MEQAKALTWSVPAHTRRFLGAPQGAILRRRHAQREVNRLDRHLEADGAIASPSYGRESPARSGASRIASSRARSLGSPTSFDRSVPKRAIVGIYMGMVPEAAIAMLACAPRASAYGDLRRLCGDAIRDRLNDAGARFVITQDGAYRRGKVLPLKPHVDAALRAY